MKKYVDSSILFSLYVQDPNSAKADQWRHLNPGALGFTGLHRVELRNALSLAVFQQRLKLRAAEAAWQVVQEDLAAGRLVPRSHPWAELLAVAEKLAAQHTPTVGSRSLDVFHVAAALVAGATEFHTFDVRQGKLAQLAGLHVS